MKVNRCTRSAPNHGPCGVCHEIQTDDSEHYTVVMSDETPEMFCAACSVAVLLSEEEWKEEEET